MFFWSYIKLASELRDGRVTDTNYTGYMILFFTLVLVQLLPLLHDEMLTGSTLLEVSLPIFVVLLATEHMNRQGDGRDFIKRFICLGVPILVHSFLLVVVLSLVAGLVIAVLENNHFMPTMMYEYVRTPVLINVIAFFAVVYILMAYLKSFRLVSKVYHG